MTTTNNQREDGFALSLRCWLSLWERAKERGTVPYGVMAGEVGLGGNIGLGPYLDVVEAHCKQERRPWLHLLAVYQDTGQPNEVAFENGLSKADWPRLCADIYAYPWGETLPPTSEAMELAAHEFQIRTPPSRVVNFPFGGAR